MKTFELLQELDSEADLQKLEEARRRRQKLIASGDKEANSARNYVAKNMSKKGGPQKPSKGKGSYTRKKVSKNDY
jgi:stalled ribosome alternative rescue factor ArfA